MRYMLISIGDIQLKGTDGIGGNKGLARQGMTVEVIDLQGADGGPELVCACPSVEAGRRVIVALTDADNREDGL